MRDANRMFETVVARAWKDKICRAELDDPRLSEKRGDNKETTHLFQVSKPLELYSIDKVDRVTVEFNVTLHCEILALQLFIHSLILTVIYMNRIIDDFVTCVEWIRCRDGRLTARFISFHNTVNCHSLFFWGKAFLLITKKKGSGTLSDLLFSRKRQVRALVQTEKVRQSERRKRVAAAGETITFFIFFRPWI